MRKAGGRGERQNVMVRGMKEGRRVGKEKREDVRMEGIFGGMFNRLALRGFC